MSIVHMDRNCLCLFQGTDTIQGKDNMVSQVVIDYEHSCVNIDLSSFSVNYLYCLLLQVLLALFYINPYFMFHYFAFIFLNFGQRLKSISVTNLNCTVVFVGVNDAMKDAFSTSGEKTQGGVLPLRHPLRKERSSHYRSK